MRLNLLPYKSKLLGEVLLLASLVGLLVAAWAFSPEHDERMVKLCVSALMLLCFSGMGIIIFSREREETDLTQSLRLKAVALVGCIYFIAFIALDIYDIWVPFAGTDIYLSFIHTVPFVYYLVFRILYRNK